MIKSIWKPFYYKSKPNYYTKIDEKYLDNKKGTTGYKVIWACDSLTCKTPNKLHSINACHLIKDKLNFDIQICRPCQCSGEGNGRFGDKRKWGDFHSEEKLKLSYSEKWKGDNRKWSSLHNEERVKELKLIYSEKWKGNNNPSLRDDVKLKKNQSIINEDLIKKIVQDKEFKLLSIINIDGKNSKFTIECNNGHISNKRYVNFVAKHKKFICSDCYYDSIKCGFKNEDLLKYMNYAKKVRSLTKTTYRRYKDIINPNNYKIGKYLYHIDHKYSILEGFKNGVPPEILSAKENLEPILGSKNCSKQSKCSITKNELYNLTTYLK